MEWKKSLVRGAIFFVFCGFLNSPKFLAAASGDAYNMDSLNHSAIHEDTLHNNAKTQATRRGSADVHAAMVRVAQGESLLAQARQRGEANEILRARRSLHEAKGYYIQILASSSGVTVLELEEMHSSGISLAQIGYDLRLLRYPSSRSYVNDHHLDMSGITMEGGSGIYHQDHADAVHNDGYDHHGTSGSNLNINNQRPVGFGGSLQRNINPHPGYYDGHSSGGGMMGGGH